MEDFSKMLEDYLDYNEIKKKIEDDELEQSEIKNNKTANKFQNTITIQEFVNYYLGTEHSCKNLRHQGLKSFNNPYVIGISNDFATKNPDCIIRNEILVVIDDYGNPGSYINPNLLRKIKTMEECKHLIKILQKVRIYRLENINKLYTEYMILQNKISDLEKSYIYGCDLLNVLNKSQVLKRIKRYVKRIYETELYFKEENLCIENLLNNEKSLIESIEKLKEMKKEKRK